MNGAEPFDIGGGEKRSFLLDGDEITLSGTCERDGIRIGFGECVGVVFPSVNLNI